MSEQRVLLIRNMKFEEFLRAVTPKVNPKAAFDLGRDAQLKTLRRVLIEKGIIDKKEIEKIEEEELRKMADLIQRMPPLPPR